jgi:MarR family transcriptional regulator for hemolysin
MANPPLKSFAEHRVNVRADAMYRIHEVSKQISLYFDQLVAAHGVTRAQWSAYMHVSQNQGATQTQLAEIMQMGRAAAGKMFDRLEEKGWIERQSDAKDNRVRRVYTRTEFEPVMKVIPTAAIELYDAFYAGMSDEDVDKLHDTLMTMLENGRNGMEKLEQARR